MLASLLSFSLIDNSNLATESFDFLYSRISKSRSAVVFFNLEATSSSFEVSFAAPSYGME